MYVPFYCEFAFISVEMSGFIYLSGFCCMNKYADLK